MKGPIFTIKEKVWLYNNAKTPWHFINIPKKNSKEIRALFSGERRSRSAIKVNITVGSTEWSSSIFWSTKEEQYILPLKAAIRKAENITAEDTVTARIQLIFQ